jgi:hypothetical protein
LSFGDVTIETKACNLQEKKGFKALLVLNIRGLLKVNEISEIKLSKIK